MTRKMKDSGVEWIGEIPEEWSLMKWGKVIRILTDYTANGSFADLAKNVQYKDEVDFARLIRLTDLRKNLNNKGVYVSEHAYNFLSKSSLYGGELLIANVGAYAGYTCEMPQIEYKATLAPNMMLIKHDEDKCISHYMYLMSQSDMIQEQLKEKANRTCAQPKLNKDDVRSVICVIPSKEEQRKIASYLDKKCNKIDQTIEKEKQVIEKLKEYKQSVITEAVTKGLNPDVKMKDSGVEWIGEIPEEWEIIDVKKIFNIVNGSTPKSDEDEYWNGDIVWITPAEMSSDTITICNSKRKITKAGMSSCGTTLVPQGSIIISNRAPIGLICIAGTELCTNQGCKSLVKMNNNINNKYYYYFMLTQVSTLNMLGRGTTFLELSTTDLSNFKVIAPNSNQNQIVDYLDKKCSAIDKLISSKEKLIDKLTEYKKSLIYECVTGKREVQ